MNAWGVISRKPIQPLIQEQRDVQDESPKNDPSKANQWGVVKRTPIAIDKLPQTSFSDFVDDVWEGISGIPLGVGASTASAIEGGDPVEISQIKDWKDGIINSARQRSKKNYEMPGAGATYVDSAGIKITRQDVRNAWQNLGFSITSMLGSIGAALGTGLVTKNPIATYGAAATAGGVLAGRMDANMIMRELRDGMDKEALSQIGRPLTDDEFVSVAKAPEMQSALREMGVEWSKRGNVGSLVREHAFDEAKWEAMSNIVMLKAGKHLFKYAQKAGLLKGLLTFAGGSAGEILFEAGTQTEQQSAEVRLGLRPGEKERSLTSFEDWKTSGEEVAGPTLLTTGPMAAVTYEAGRIAGGTEEDRLREIARKEREKLEAEARKAEEAARAKAEELARQAEAARLVGQQAQAAKLAAKAVPEPGEEPPPTPIQPMATQPSVGPSGAARPITPGETPATEEKPPLEGLIQDGDIIRSNGKPFSTEKAAILIAKSRRLEGYVPVEVEQDQWVLRKPTESVRTEQAQPPGVAQAIESIPLQRTPESPPVAAVAPTPPIPPAAQTAVEGAPMPAAPPRVETVTAPPEAAKPAITYERETSDLQDTQRQGAEGEVQEPADDRRGQLALSDTAGLPAEDAKTQLSDNFYVRYKQVTVGEFRSGLDTVTTPEEVAHVVAPLRKHAQEAFLALVTDANGKILNLIRHTKGIKAGATVDAATVAAAIAATDGAVNVWFVHNHPSGAAEPSNADGILTEVLYRSLDGTGIRPRGHVVLGAGSSAHYFVPNGESRGIKIKPFPRSRAVPVTERIIRKTPAADRPVFSNPDATRAFVSTLRTKNAVVLLDNKHAVAGVVALSRDEMMTLRKEGRVNRILRAIDATNASAAIVVSEDAAANSNVSRFLNNLGGVSVLDAMTHTSDGTIRSSAERGDSVHEGRMPWFSRKPSRGVSPATDTAALSHDAVEAVVDRLGRALGLPGEMKIITHPSEDALFAAVPSIADQAKAQGAEGEIGAVYQDGAVHVVSSFGFRNAAEVEEAVLHEAYGHYGARQLFGQDLNRAMNRLFLKLGGKSGIAALAEKYGIDLDAYLRTAKIQAAKGVWNNERVALYLTDELLAHMQGQKAHETLPQRIVRAIQEFIGAIRDILRKRGWAELSKVSDADLAHLLRKMSEAARAPAHGEELEAAQFMREARPAIIDIAVPGYNKFGVTKKDNEMQGQPMFSRKTPIGLQHNEPLLKQAGEFVQDFTHASKLNILHKTISTQQHKAKAFPETFGPVFEEADAFIRDTSRIANESADLADDLLIRIESFKDLLKTKPSKKSIQKIADALHEGTLAGGGSPMKGVIWGDNHLKRYFKMDDKEISYYHQALNAVANSNDELAKSIIYKYIRKLPISFDRGMTLEDIYASVDDQLNTLADGYQMAIDSLSERDGNIEGFQKKLNDIRARQDAITDATGIAQKLRESGYFPLKRFGEYAISVYEGKNLKFFGMYESKTAFAFAKNRVRKEYPSGEIRTNTVDKESYKLYQGMSLDIVEAFAEHLDIGSDPVMQEFLRVALAERNILKHRIHRKGILGQSQDIPRSLGAYILSSSRSASSAYHLANMIELADRIEEGDIKADASKLVKFIQVPVEEAHKLRSFLFYNFIGGSIAHGAIQLTQPIMTTAPFLVQYTSYHNAITELAKAANDYRKPGKLTGKLASDYARAAEEGVRSPQEIHQLRADAEKSFLGGNATIRKLVFAWGSIYSITEQMNRSITFLAAYRIGEKMGATKLKEAGFDNVYDFAKDAVDQTQFIYSKASRPNLFRGKVGATVGTFKQFSISYLELFIRLYKTDKKAAAIMATTLFFMAGLSGFPFTDDVEDLIDTIGQWMGHGTNSKKAVREWAEKEIGEVGYDIMSKGVSGIPGFPIDVSARLGLPNLLPGSSALMPAEKNKQREVVEVLGPAGQLLPIEGTQAGNALERLAKGDLFGAAKSGLPVAFQNYLKGYEMMKTGEYKDYRGIPVMPVTEKEGAAKFIGFQPARVKKQVEIEREVLQDKAMHDLVESSIADKWAKGVFYDNQELQNEATAELQDWNDKNPDIPVVIMPQQMKERMEGLSQTRAQRITSRAPKEMRGKIGENVQRD